ncbi:4Fe-4S binding protein [Methanosalsum natronophilum]|uniref:4Fe-4S dicluster domain-containing protein n=1 Tax=Methanosalsum natronophilum TaxID=768733 RepID=A0A424YUF6_9EURY|nr:4Fe-4S binding protein [Methanosalsum natronophilum]MCS3924825.1 ferredoxin [Methanosalsum natronophilum]RQD82601.1 MAG: 4Fe-4S dicluster domain-containing protein [Methanosalsum natronophilum]
MKIRIDISSDIVGKPIVAESIVETGALLNISQAHLDSTRGELVADIENEKYTDINKALTKRGAKVTVLDTPIIRDEDECIECGACISVCPVDVFSFEADWSLKVEQEKCIQCGTCIQMCPHNALSLER